MRRRDTTALTAGVLAGAIHFLFALSVWESPSEGSWGWLPVFVADLPVSLIGLPVSGPWLPPLIGFGLIGSIWWFAIGYALVRVARKLAAHAGRKGRPDAHAR